VVIADALLPDVLRAKRVEIRKRGRGPSMQSFDPNSKHFNIYISLDRREAFWRTLILLGRREQAKHSQGNPFDTVYASTVVVDTIIALAEIAEHPENEEASEQIQPVNVQQEDGQSLPSFAENDTLWLSISQKKRQRFWQALIVLGNQELARLGGRDPFEAISISSLITAKILALGGFAVEADLETLSRPMPNMQRETLTISTSVKKRQRFWTALSDLARRERSASDSPFKGVNKSALVADILIALGDAAERGVEIEDTFLVERLDFSSRSDLSVPPQPTNTQARTLVLYLNEENRERFWRALTVLGTQELARMENNPFIAVSISALITDKIISLWEKLGGEVKEQSPVPAHINRSSTSPDREDEQSPGTP
jgi:hypothetical protein